MREAYLLFGRRPDLTARQDPLVPPRELSFDDSGTAVVFRVENQYCAEWGWYQLTWPASIRRA